MLWFLLIIAVAIVAAAVLVKLPMKVSRSIVIQKDRQTVYDITTDFNQWRNWSPWAMIEPGCTINVTGSGTEEGSVYYWEGELLGAGEIEHKSMSAPDHTEQEIRFLKPMKSQGVVRFLFADKDGGTQVTWEMDSTMPAFLFFMVKMMQAWIGYDYDRGLKMLKIYIEDGAVHSKVDIQDIVDVPEQTLVGIRQQCSFEEIGPSMEKAFEKLMNIVHEEGVELVGPPVSLYHKWDMLKGEGDYTAAVPVSAGTTVSNLETTTMPALKAIKVLHTGPYHFVGNGWSCAMMYARSKKMKERKDIPAFETYTNDPKETDPKDLLTEIYLPI